MSTLNLKKIVVIYLSEVVCLICYPAHRRLGGIPPAAEGDPARRRRILLICVFILFFLEVTLDHICNVKIEICNFLLILSIKMLAHHVK